MIYEGSLMNEGRDEKFTVAQFRGGPTCLNN